MADNDGGSDEVRALRPLQAAACADRIAFGLRAGQKVLTKQAAMPRTRASSRRLVLTSTASACTLPCAAALAPEQPMNGTRQPQALDALTMVGLPLAIKTAAPSQISGTSA